jgi:hypothetical protein
VTGLLGNSAFASVQLVRDRRRVKTGAIQDCMSAFLRYAAYRGASLALPILNGQFCREKGDG